MSKALGLDFGKARCGVAISDDAREWAFPRETFNVDSWNALINFIVQMVSDEDVTDIVVGRPQAQKGQETEMTHEAERFVEELKKNVSVNVRLVDERMTSRLADRIMHQSERKSKKGDRDSIAAAAILQTFLNKERDGS